LTLAECSLPKLLFGHNGRLIEDQAQIEEALQKLFSVLTTAAVMPPVKLWKVWRADMAYNFALPARAIIVGHSHLRVPGINSPPGTWGEQSVAWTGGQSRFAVKFYDKAREIGSTGSVLRVEISLCGEKLSKYLPAANWRNFQSLWSVYRNVLASIPPIQKPLETGGWQEALGREAPEIQSRIMASLMHKNEKTRRTYWQRITASSSAEHLATPFSWSKLLSPDGPPSPIHVVPVT
jgi:hypothetical protein